MLHLDAFDVDSVLNKEISDIDVSRVRPARFAAVLLESDRARIVSVQVAIPTVGPSPKVVPLFYNRLELLVLLPVEANDEEEESPQGITMSPILVRNKADTLPNAHLIISRLPID
jgi:hypothetical protein